MPRNVLEKNKFNDNDEVTETTDTTWNTRAKNGRYKKANVNFATLSAKLASRGFPLIGHEKKRHIESIGQKEAHIETTSYSADEDFTLSFDSTATTQCPEFYEETTPKYVLEDIQNMINCGDTESTSLTDDTDLVVTTEYTGILDSINVTTFKKEDYKITLYHVR